jgi:diguanylate cyclase
MMMSATQTAVRATSSSRPLADKAQIDTSSDLLRRTLALMSRHAAGYAPDSYALWYEYVLGSKPALREEIDALVNDCERLSLKLTFDLHQKHLSERAEDSVRKAGAGLLEVMSTMRSSMEVASSDANVFDAQLAAFGENLSSASSAEDLTLRVDTMRSDVERMNKSMSTLNARLEASHRTVASLQNELKRARDEASLDALTGILNRRGFDAELARHCRESSDAATPLCLVMVDIDHFKKINDNFGHPFGDKVIRAVGQAMSQLTQRKDVAARYGGEEFALLLPETSATEAREVADRIRRAISRGQIKGNGAEPVGNITISAGVAEFVRGEDPTSLTARADRALYAAKQGGRNQVTIDR